MVSKENYIQEIRKALNLMPKDEQEQLLYTSLCLLMKPETTLTSSDKNDELILACIEKGIDDWAECECVHKDQRLCYVDGDALGHKCMKCGLETRDLYQGD